MSGVLGKVGRFARTTLAAIGLGTVTTGVLVTLTYKRLVKEKLKLQPDLTLPAEGFILEIDLEDVELSEKQSGGLQALLSKSRPKLELQKAVRALKVAGGDERVVGLLALVGDLGKEAGLAQVQELRQAVQAFREKAQGRAASVAYADSFGDVGGTGVYYLASAFEHLYVMPTGFVGFTGLAVQAPFARKLLDRFKIKPLVVQREEFKSALSFATGSGFTEPERHATTSLLQDLSSQIIADVAAGRRLTAQAVQAAVDGAPHTAHAAIKLGLVDAALYRDQAAKMVARLAELKARGPLKAASVLEPNKQQHEQQEVKGQLHAQQEEQQQPGQQQQQAVQQAVQQGSSGGFEAAARALLATPDAEPSRQLKRVPLQKYIKVVEAQQAQRLKLKQVDSLQQALKDLHRMIKEDGDETEEVDKTGQQKAKAKQLQGVLGSLQVPMVAVLTLTGPISQGREEPSPTSSSQKQIASLPVVKALEKVRSNPAIKAVVLRIDSPGGSAVASDAIHRQVLRLRQSGKTVVVSMGNAAASGGYYISCPANKIVAQPATLTGSIGVLAGKFNAKEFLEDQGINFETIKTGKNADALSFVDGYTEEQEAHVNRLIDDVYAHFLERVAEGRGKPLEEVRALAKGRVWTGQQALAHGLVDALGGLDDAVRLAKLEAKLPLEEDAVLVQDVWPEPRGTIGRLVDLVKGRESLPGAAALLALLLHSSSGSQQVAADPAVKALLVQGGQQLVSSQAVLQSGRGPQLFSVQVQQLLSSLR
ncbi:hypothetical protein N2152v2_002455 [Parachlorella kessleri]